ncbi:hypothetical protein EW145_g7167 [Phellinidium pouzarii]|uniref:Uncharacterized protein n=1 Tax=Phellinidium pouzarii TaxID=167371 RepID=A0A4S4KP15_9AGAM|nr:hypothetical protein EW145_g7167 [Phellinidium pouzarii]
MPIQTIIHITSQPELHPVSRFILDNSFADDPNLLSFQLWRLRTRRGRLGLFVRDTTSFNEFDVWDSAPAPTPTDERQHAPLLEFLLGQYFGPRFRTYSSWFYGWYCPLYIRFQLIPRFIIQEVAYTLVHSNTWANEQQREIIRAFDWNHPHLHNFDISSDADVDHPQFFIQDPKDIDEDFIGWDL